MLIHARLPSNLWGHAMLHAFALLRLCPTLLHTQIPLELVSRRTPNVSHLRTFGCRVWVPIPEPQRKTIRTHHQEGVYVGYDSPRIIRYLSILIGTLLRARFQNSHFDENTFPSLPNTKNAQILDFFAPQTFIHNPNPCTALSEQEVRKLGSVKALFQFLNNIFHSILHFLYPKSMKILFKLYKFINIYYF